MMSVAGSNSVRAVYSAEYHRAPEPREKSGAHAPNPGLKEYGAMVKRGGRQRANETSHPAPRPAIT